MSDSALMLQEMNEEYEAILAKKSSAAQSIEQRKEELRSLRKSYDALTDDTELAAAKVHNLKTKSAAQDLIDVASAELDSLQDQRDMSRKSMARMEAELADLSSQLHMFTKLTADISARMEEIAKKS